MRGRTSGGHQSCFSAQLSTHISTQEGPERLGHSRQPHALLAFTQRRFRTRHGIAESAGAHQHQGSPYILYSRVDLLLTLPSQPSPQYAPFPMFTDLCLYSRRGPVGFLPRIGDLYICSRCSLRWHSRFLTYEFSSYTREPRTRGFLAPKKKIPEVGERKPNHPPVPRHTLNFGISWILGLKYVSAPFRRTRSTVQFVNAEHQRVPYWSSTGLMPVGVSFERSSLTR
jgi:hypothetical protein